MYKLKNLNIVGVAFLMMCVLAACNDTSRTAKKDRSVGGTAEIMVVTQNEEQWKGMVGDSIRHFFLDYQYGLPQPESRNELAHLNLSGFSDLLKKHKCILEVEIDPTLEKAKAETAENDCITLELGTGAEHGDHNCQIGVLFPLVIVDGDCFLLEIDVQVIVFAEADVRQNFVHVSSQAGEFRDEDDVDTVLHSIGETLVQDKTVAVLLRAADVFFERLHDFDAVFGSVIGQIDNLTLCRLTFSCRGYTCIDNCLHFRVVFVLSCFKSVMRFHHTRFRGVISV